MGDAHPGVPPVPPAGGVTSDGAGAAIDQGRARTFPCAGCGAALSFSIEAQSLACGFCGTVRDLASPDGRIVAEQDLRAALRDIAEGRVAEAGRRRGDEEIVHEVRCGDCGADVRFTGSLTSDECPYCGTAIQLDGVHDAEDRVRVDGVLPFGIDHEVARKNLAAWVKSRWFAPNEFLRRGASGRFHGVYLPFWTYDALTLNAYAGERGEHYWVTVRHGDQTRRERRTRWYPASGTFRRFFDDVLVFAGAGFPAKLIEKLDPWPLERCVPYSPEFLAGYLARTYDTSLEDGFGTAKGRIHAAIRADVQRRIGGDAQRIHGIDTEFGALTYKHLLLPVWLLVYRFRGKPYQVAVNAVTGEVQGARPWSFWKILFAVVVGIAAVGGAAWWIHEQNRPR
jgi:DNA-directed RNA polymerase subunit RPC12/RpoP